MADFGKNPQHGDMSQEAVEMLQKHMLDSAAFTPEAKEYVNADFGMSQFWYDDDSAATLAIEALSFEGRIAFISCPTAFKAMKKVDPMRQDVFCFEFDKRFGELWNHEYVFYDFNEPFAVPEELKGTFDFIMADPPYLNAKTMSAFSKTMDILAKTPKTPQVFNTGATLEEHAATLGFVRSGFEPGHSHHIMNKFLSYTKNYHSDFLSSNAKPVPKASKESASKRTVRISNAQGTSKYDELGCAMGYSCVQ